MEFKDQNANVINLNQVKVITLQTKIKMWRKWRGEEMKSASFFFIPYSKELVNNVSV